MAIRAARHGIIQILTLAVKPKLLNNLRDARLAQAGRCRGCLQWSSPRRLPSGLRLVTESMPHVRSVSVGVWLTRGSRHETDARERHRALRRAHALQGHRRRASARGHRADDRFDRRPARRVHREGIRQLLHQGARRAPAARRRSAERHGAAARVRAGRHRARAEGHPRRDQDGRGHAGRSRSTRFHRSTSGRTIRSAGRFSAPGDRRVVHAGVLRDYFAAPTSRRTSIIAAAGNLEHAALRALVEPRSA